MLNISITGQKCRRNLSSGAGTKNLPLKMLRRCAELVSPGEFFKIHMYKKFDNHIIDYPNENLIRVNSGAINKDKG